MLTVVIKVGWWGNSHVYDCAPKFQLSVGTYYCVGARSKEMCTVIYCKLHPALSWCFLVTMAWNWRSTRKQIHQYPSWYLCCNTFPLCVVSSCSGWRRWVREVLNVLN